MAEIIKDSFKFNEGFNSGKITRGVLYEKTHDDNGKEIIKKISENTIVFGGAMTALEKLTGTQAKFKPATLNEILDVPVSGATPGNETIALFGVGIGGSGLDWGSVVAPDIKQRNVIDPIPLRYGSVLNDSDANMYYMKKSNAGDPGTYSWYLKEFTEEPIISAFWKNAIETDEDGTEITGEIYDSNSTEGIETFAEFHFNLNRYDVRDYFEATGDLSYARYNTFGFYLGEKVGNEYANVRLFSVVTFKNRDVSESTTSEYIYRVYALV